MKNIACPVCHLPLEMTENLKSLTCANGHLFDMAKQGYVNLLLSQQKKSKHPGDTPEMVAARTRFLNKSYYAAIADKLESLILSYIATLEASPKNSAEELNVCDIACGEGYYTQRLHNKLGAEYSLTTTGFDISTPAIKAASKRDKHLQWIIASGSNIPVSKQSQDVLSCLFCRVDFEGAAKIAKPGALFVIAETGQNHLIELREKLYDQLKDEVIKQPLSEINGFRLQSRETLSTSVNIQNSEDLEDLLMMTPHFWRVKADKKAALRELASLVVTLDVNFHIYRAS